MKLPEVRAGIVEADSGLEISAEEMRSRIRRRIGELGAAGMRNRDRFVLWAHPSISFLTDLLAGIELGAVCFVADSQMTPQERASYLQSVEPEWESSYELEEGRKLSEYLADRGQNTTSVRSEIPDDAVLVFHTSGTSARPKNVIHRIENLRARISLGEKALSEKVLARSLCALPLHFGHGLIGVCLQALFSGQKLILAPRVSMEALSQVSIWVDAHEVTFISGTPALWSLILRVSKPTARGTLLRAQVASAHTGEELFRSIHRWSGAPVWNVYGMTEAASWVSDCLIVNAEGAFVANEAEKNNVGSGRNWGTQFKILDADDSGVGEVLMSSPSLFAGYLGQWTKAIGRQEWFRTGDLGRIDAMGSLHLVGRSSRVINRGGTKVSPEEVENRIRESAAEFGIEDVVVLEAPSSFGYPGVGVLLVLKGDGSIDSDHVRSELERALRLDLSAPKVPSEYRFVKSIPRRENGKPDLFEIGLLWNRLTKG